MIENDDSIAFRLPKLYKKMLLERCEKNNLTISKYMMSLVEKELFGNEKVVTDRMDEVLSWLERIDKKISEPTESKTKAAPMETTNVLVPVKKVGTVKKTAGVRGFTTKPWEVNGQLPCPVCKIHWEVSTNIDRHFKKHGTTRREVYTNPDYIKIADELVEKRKSNI